MRMTRPIAVALLLSLAPAATSLPAFAQPAPADDATTTMARARFKEGVEYYDKGEYELARASFLQAYALKKHPAVLLNLGWSCLKSGHALEAERYFKQFLSEGREITDKQRADANDGAAQARTKLGRIDVLVPAGTDVSVDGDHLGVAPLAEPVFVEGGAHTVKLRTADGTVDTQSVTVLSGERTVARLKAATPAAAPAAPPVVAPPPPAPVETPAPAPPPTPKVPAPEAVHPAPRPAPAPPPPAKIESEGGPGPFAAPKNLFPMFLLGGVAILGYGTGALFLVFKGQAQSKADSITTRLGTIPGASCPPSDALKSMIGSSCDALSKNNDQINEDATVGNIGLAVGVAATAGVLVYWVLSDKKGQEHASAAPVLAPILGPNLGGLSLSGAF